MKLTNKKLCELCEKTTKVDMLQNGKGITEDVFKGVKKVKASMSGLSKVGKKVVKDAVKLFNDGKISIEDAIKNSKPYVEQLMFKKGKGFTTANFTEHFGSGLRLPGKERCGGNFTSSTLSGLIGNIAREGLKGKGMGVMEKNIPVGSSNSVGQGVNLPGPSGKGMRLPGKRGKGTNLPGHSTSHIGGSSITSVHSTINKGRGKAKGKPNAWVCHLQAYRCKHPNKSYKQCMIDAKATYKK